MRMWRRILVTRPTDWVGVISTAAGAALLALMLATAHGCAASGQQVTSGAMGMCSYRGAGSLGVGGGQGDVHIRCESPPLPTGHRLVLDGDARLRLLIEVDAVDEPEMGGGGED